MPVAIPTNWATPLARCGMRRFSESLGAFFVPRMLQLGRAEACFVLCFGESAFKTSWSAGGRRKPVEGFARSASTPLKRSNTLYEPNSGWQTQLEDPAEELSGFRRACNRKQRSGSGRGSNPEYLAGYGSEGGSV